MAHPRQGSPNQRAVTPPPFHHVLARGLVAGREQVTRETFGHGRRRADRKNPRRAHPFAAKVLETRLDEAMREAAR